MKTIAIRDTLVPLETRIPNCLFYNSNATAFLLSTRIKQSRRIPCRGSFLTPVHAGVLRICNGRSTHTYSSEELLFLFLLTSLHTVVQ